MRPRVVIGSVYCALAVFAFIFTLPAGNAIVAAAPRYAVNLLTNNLPGGPVLPRNASPDLALLLLSFGALGIGAEFLLPGGIVSGAAGAFLTMLGLAAVSTFPVHPRGFVFFLAALLLVLAESRYVAKAKVAVCAALTVAAALLLFAGIMTTIGGGTPTSRVHPALALIVAFSLTPLASFLFCTAIRAHLNKTLLAAAGVEFANGRERNVILRRAGTRSGQITRSGAGQSQT